MSESEDLFEAATRAFQNISRAIDFKYKQKQMINLIYELYPDIPKEKLAKIVKRMTKKLTRTNNFYKKIKKGKRC
ncbi:MAG: hypothetical protein IJ086_06855 [Clostridium sp.]|nr:hypothetical protein [Clostridium sp.]MBQ9298773.1 hypothetical protein [Clostridia bacterium]